MKNWLKTLLFVSAFSPTLLTLAVVRYFSIGSDTIFFQLIFVSVAGICLPLLILRWVDRETESLHFSAKTIEPADHYLLMFIGSYVAPFVMKLADIHFGATVLVVGVLCLVSWLVTNIPSHPVLYLARFRFYKAESESGMVYVLIARRFIRSPQSLTSVKPISSGMLMESSRANEPVCLD